MLFNKRVAGKVSTISGTYSWYDRMRDTEKSTLERMYERLAERRGRRRPQ